MELIFFMLLKNEFQTTRSLLVTALTVQKRQQQGLLNVEFWGNYEVTFLLIVRLISYKRC